jgi:PP-loop superfamily ATP-utilizing enzyme
VNKQQVKELALSNGFKLKQQPSGEMDLNPYVYEFAEDLLAKANERVEELEKSNRTCAVAIREIIAKGEIGSLLITGDKLDEIVNKFAIEQKIEALKELLTRKSHKSVHHLIEIVIDSYENQLRKEQGHG